MLAVVRASYPAVPSVCGARGPSLQLAFALTNEFVLLEVDHAEQSGQIIVGTSGEEKLVGGTI